MTAAAFAAAFFLVGPAANIAHAQTDVYVANTTANAVNLIHTNSAAPGLDADPIGVATGPSQIVISGDGQWAFVAYTGLTTVTRMSTTPPRQTTTFDVGGVPISIAVSRNGGSLYVLRAAGDVVGFDTGGDAALPLNTANGPIPIAPSAALVASLGGIALTPDDSTLFVACGDLTVIDVSTRTPAVRRVVILNDVNAPAVDNFAVAIATDAAGTAYLAVDTYDYGGFDGFSARGGIWAADANQAHLVAPLFALPGSIAVAGNRVYAGIRYLWADSLYGAGFLPADWVATIEVVGGAAASSAWINLGAAAPAPGIVHMPAGLVVTADRSTVLVAIPSVKAVAVIDATTNQLLDTETIALNGEPKALAAVPDSSAPPTQFKLVAGNDATAAPVPAAGRKPAIDSVLANDTLGGVPATLATVKFAGSTASLGVTLDETTGAVWIADGVDAGVKTFTYTISEIATPSNRATATVTLMVRERNALAAVGDAARTVPGALAIANVLDNDALNPATRATVGNVSIVVSALDSLGGVTLDGASGAVTVDAAASFGTHTISYHICEIAAQNCSGDAQVAVNVVNRPIAAASDSATAPRTGANAIVNVLTNDTLDGSPAGGRVRFTPGQVSPSFAPGVTLDPSGFVSVAHGAPATTYTLTYTICEAARPSDDNCAQGTAAITVNPYVITTVADSARLSPKNPATAIANVLANDMLGDTPATIANVRIVNPVVTPATDKVVLSAATGAVSVLKNAVSGLFTINYQVCEADTLANCANATATINLSNGGGGGGGGGGRTP